jgi:serine O-acetyltransferase
MPCFPHGLSGIFISGGARIGKNVVIFQHVTIGSNTLIGSSKFGSPAICDDCYIGAGAKIIGNILVGRSTRIGANAVLTNDVPESSVIYTRATIRKRVENSDNRYFTYRNGKFFYFHDGRYVEASREEQERLKTVRK